MDEKLKKKLMENQLHEVGGTLNNLGADYWVLMQKRYNNTLTRDELFIYELMDALKGMEAIYRQATSGIINANYISEKLDFMQRYIDAAKKYFKVEEKEGK